MEHSVGMPSRRKNSILAHVQIVQHDAKPICLIVLALLLPSKEEKDSFRSGPHGFGVHSCQSFFEALENKPERTACIDFVGDPRHRYSVGTSQWVGIDIPS